MLSTKIKKDKAFVIAISVFIISGFLLQAINLSNIVPFHDWDEAIYAQVAKEFVRAPSLLLTYNGAPWFEKPPLPSILYAMSWLFPLKKEFSARFVSLLFSLVSLFALYKILAELKMSKTLRLLAIFVALASSMYLDRSMLVNVDIMLTTGWLIYVLGTFKNKMPVKVAGLLIGTLSKSLLGFFPLFAEIFTDIVSRKISKKKLLNYFSLFTAGSLWHLYMTITFGQPFIREHFVDHLVSRVTRPIELHFGDKWFYIIKLWGETNIFLILAAVGFVFVFLRVFESTRLSKTLPKNISHYLILAVLPLAYITLLTFSRSKLHWYITPLIPFVGIWVSILFENLAKSKYAVVKKIIPFAYIAIATYCLYIFAKSVNNIQPDWYKPTDKTIIGICLGKYTNKNDKIVYLVPPQQRKDAHVIEAAKLQIGSSFIYGSAPAFLYYADKPVKFVYKDTDYEKSLASGNVTVVSKADLKDQKILVTVGNWLKADKNGFSPLCETETLTSYRKVF